MKPLFIFWLAASSIIFISAASASRTYISTNNMLWVVLSMSLYIVGNLIMIWLMREGGMGLAISVSSVAQLILANVVAFAIFHEKISPIQMGGLTLGFVAVVLMLWPQNGVQS